MRNRPSNSYKRIKRHNGKKKQTEENRRSLRRELSGRKDLAGRKHEVRSERERGEGGSGRSNKHNGEEEKRAADEDETIVSTVEPVLWWPNRLYV